MGAVSGFSGKLTFTGLMLPTDIFGEVLIGKEIKDESGRAIAVIDDTRCIGNDVHFHAKVLPEPVKLTVDCNEVRS